MPTMLMQSILLSSCYWVVFSNVLVENISQRNISSENNKTLEGKFQTTFSLFIPKSKNNSEILKNHDDFNIASTRYMCGADTKVIIHGLISNAAENWVQKMKNALLSSCKCNVITVDWSLKASDPDYKKVVENTEVVGTELAKLISKLTISGCTNAKSFHLIGHSLGAHVAGFSGSIANGSIGRITGLDPAGPLFDGAPPKSRLDPSDAAFVDIIHTNTGDNVTTGFGIAHVIGHQDFFPNGGKVQPGCPKILLDFQKANYNMDKVLPRLTKESIDALICHHYRAHELFTSTILAPPSKALAYACRTYKDFLKGQCRSCGSARRNCAVMGYYAREKKNVARSRKNMMYFVRTLSKEPFFGNSGTHVAFNRLPKAL